MADAERVIKGTVRQVNYGYGKGAENQYRFELNKPGSRPSLYFLNTNLSCFENQKELLLTAAREKLQVEVQIEATPSPPEAYAAVNQLYVWFET